MAILVFISALVSVTHAAQDGKSYLQGTDAQGVTRKLANDRYPALYTGEFGDCLGGQSLINVTGFDAAYYADNMTVLFHLTGSTNLRNESVMMYISVDAYGEDRFDLIFNPCSANIYSLCPMNASSSILAEAIIPVGQSDVSGIPDIALAIPDFEGHATLRFFSNSTQTEIGCFQAVMKNGASLSHPKAVAPVLGIFTIVAMLASFATAVYGVSIPAIRTHYAHSLSVLVIFETFQSIFFSGALSLQWPSVCAAWWSNFAWAAGMIHIPSMTNSIDNFTGNNGNSSQVGGAGSVPINNNGGLRIYGRATSSMTSKTFNAVMAGRRYANRLLVRETTPEPALGPGYSWMGGPVHNGMPVPGLWSNFTGELSEIGIPASNAFLTGLIWFLIALVVVIGATVGFKWALEAFSAIKWIKHDRLALFRSHWLGFLQIIVLRTLTIAFFAMMTLTLYQFSIASSGATAGVIAIAAIVFVVFFVGLLAVAAYACFYRLRLGKYETRPDHIVLLHKRVWKIFPSFNITYRSKLEQQGVLSTTKHTSMIPTFRIQYIDHNPDRQSVHEDQSFVKRFGWLTARYRRTRWWFFTIWLIYQFVRACFIGGASKSPEVQVYGIFVVEIIVMIVIVKMNPFEGSRNTALAVYLLSISKVITAGLSIAFLPRFNLPRIPATVVGFVIIITQALVTIALLILIVLGAISSYMSLTRNREDFKPHNLEGVRFKYFTHLETKAPDVPVSPAAPLKVEEPKEPYFSVNNVRRAPKIEDEDADMVADMPTPLASQVNLAGRQSRAGSMRSNTPISGVGGLPYGARVHRASWSSRDFASWQQDGLGDSPYRAPSRHDRHDSGAWSTTNTPSKSISMVPLVPPQAPPVSYRSGTLTEETTLKHGN